MIKHILISLTFLTRIPIRINFTFGEEDFGKTLRYFPIAGMVIGSLVSLGMYIFGMIAYELGAIIGVFLGIMLTGGLHLDGVMDTADGVFSARSKEKMLEIMKDSRVGAHGVTAGIILILFKFVVYQIVLKQDNFIWFIIMSFILSRWVLVFVTLNFEGARKEGIAQIFIKYKRPGDFFVASMFTLMPVIVFAKWISLIPVFITIIIIWLISRYLVNLLGGLTGDTYGAMAEMSEVLFLFLMLLTESSLIFLQQVM